MMGIMDPQNEPLTKKIFFDGLSRFEAHIDAKLDARFGVFESRMNTKLDARFVAFESYMDAKLDARFGAFESNIDAKFDTKLNKLESKMDEKIDALALSTQQEFTTVQQEFVAVRREMAEGFASIRTEIGVKIWESESRILRAIGDIAAVLKNHDSRLLMLERIVKP